MFFIKKAGRKIKSIVDVTELKTQMSLEENRLESYFQNLGRTYFVLKKDTPDKELEELVSLIKKSFSTIDEIKIAIDAAENRLMCNICGTEILEDMAFCVGCGAPIDRNEKIQEMNKIFCTNCGIELHESDSFCRRCGEKIEK